MKTKLKIAALSIALFSALLLSACHTAHGFGQDVEHGGQAIQEAAIDNG